MRPNAPSLLLFLSIACGGFVACSGGPTKPIAATSQPNVGTATPYAQAPVPTIVDASGHVAGSPPTASDNPLSVTYDVVAGDTLLAIATRFDTTVAAIMQRNNVTDPTDLKIGQELVIPTSSTVIGTATPAPTSTVTPTDTATPEATSTPASTAAPSSTPSATATAPAAGTLTYTVQAGDTAFDIAGRFGVAVEDLAAANNRTVASLASIQIGDKLLIPEAR